MKRRRAREFALQFLYAFDTQQEDPSLETILGRFSSLEDQSHMDLPYLHKLVEEFLAHHEEIDAAIESHSENWRLERMPRVDRNILRVAAAEILYVKDITLNIAIDEALEIAKRFGTEESAPFINGILDSIAKSRP